MYNFVSQISERCHRSATRRGKDTSCLGCLKYLHAEFSEYWAAFDEGRNAPKIDDIMRQVRTIPADDFVAYYHASVHNTAVDELADILIVAASWYEAARLAGDLNEDVRTIDVVLLNGAVHFVNSQLKHLRISASDLRQIVFYKMQYNELRND